MTAAEWKIEFARLGELYNWTPSPLETELWFSAFGYATAERMHKAVGKLYLHWTQHGSIRHPLPADLREAMPYIRQDPPRDPGPPSTPESRAAAQEARAKIARMIGSLDGKLDPANA